MRLTNIDPALRRCWHPVARSSEIGTNPVKVTLLGEDWAVVRLPSGLAAFVDRCPHRLAPLSAGQVRGEVLQCGYHGWCFADDGSCTDIPSIGRDGPRPGRALATIPAGLTERRGIVFLAPQAPLTELLDVPEAVDPTFDHGELDTMTAEVGAGLLADNFLDMSHFPFLHAATIGTAEAKIIHDFEIDRLQFGMTVRSRHPFPNREDPAVATGERPLIQHRRLTYEYRAPFLLSLRIDYEEAGGANVIVAEAQPVDAQRCRIYVSVHRNDLRGDEARLAEALSFERKIFDEDLNFQERYVDKSLPLDMTTEVHVKADRVTVELRRILSELVAATATGP